MNTFLKVHIFPNIKSMHIYIANRQRGILLKNVDILIKCIKFTNGDSDPTKKKLIVKH